ncbi:sulfite exporter TauE/SafE family protein [Solimonas sp. K1W22B-7]|uniref:sulfite exporter TauE/SafE family protein n=1 Tax=Solimonas sp. K1W22B-7 TaxID=2303331 RepID=UPI000E337ACC|nr:sulfite exporter TauE/SafE family protein [Solimonas sp. K1W22B-7]AXQ28858.1 sulfite exporter TauE/SafE family protein [Solimonas sp. K1W22B-7]
MSPTEATLLAGAAFLAGGLNALAGGGSFLTLPALMAVGVPPVAANATGTVALLPGYLSAAWASRQDLRTPAGLGLPLLLGLALAGGASGAALLLLTPDRLFAGIAPLLLLAATLLFALQPRLQQRLRGAAVPRPVAALTVFAVCAYGGYFNGGLGILLLAALSMLGLRDLNQANALKNRVSGVLTAIAVTLYAAGNAVHWGPALWMMLFATAGGYAGARWARRIPPARLRAFIVLTGLVMAGLIAARL